MTKVHAEFVCAAAESPPPPVLAATRALRQSLAKEPKWDVILKDTSATSSTVIIVDAYNVIYHWPRLKK